MARTDAIIRRNPYERLHTVSFRAGRKLRRIGATTTPQGHDDPDYTFMSRAVRACPGEDRSGCRGGARWRAAPGASVAREIARGFLEVSAAGTVAVRRACLRSQIDRVHQAAQAW